MGNPNQVKPIPITVFTGFIGAGKTTTILSLLSQLPKDYKVVLLKNEFGDVEVDSQLAKSQNMLAVSEILNGCLCCVLVGQMQTALLEIREKYRPDRIIIECSGSAFPATLAFQIRELERETGRDLRLDAIVTVIDAENFIGYEDTSPTAKMQSSYTDILLINKWEHVSDRQLDTVIDHLNTLNDETPKIRCQGRNGVNPDFIFGLETKLFLQGITANDVTHNDEIETATIYRGSPSERPHTHTDKDTCGHCHSEAHDADSSYIQSTIEEDLFRSALSSISKEVVWRVKGFVCLDSKWYILNWAFSRYDLTPIDDKGDRMLIKLTVMGERGELKRAARKLAAALDAELL